MKLLLAPSVAVLLASVLLSAACAQPAADDFETQLDQERLDQSGTVITIIFDDSGSMKGERLSQAKEAFAAWLPTVPEEHRLGLYALNGGALAKWRRNNREDVANAVGAIQANGGTPLAAVIQHLGKLVRERQKSLPYERHVLVVFTDGQDSTDEGTAGVLRQIRNARGSGVEVVGIGFHGQGDYMKRDATRYFDANNTKELAAGLQKVDAEIGDTSDVKIEPDVLELMKSVTFEAPSQPQTRQAPAPMPQAPTGSRIDTFFVVIVTAVVLGTALLAGLKHLTSGPR